MRLGDYLEKTMVFEDLKASAKAEVLAELIGAVSAARANFDQDKALRVLMERENLGTTGIGDNVAIPHGKLENLDEIVLVVGRSSQGVEFDALDFKPCHIFFLVLAPEQVAGMHLRILAHISRLLKDEVFRKAFLEAADKETLWQLLSDT